MDDSNGTVGGFIEETVIVLLEYSKLKPSCIDLLRGSLEQKKTGIRGRSKP